MGAPRFPHPYYFRMLTRLRALSPSPLSLQSFFLSRSLATSPPMAPKGDKRHSDSEHGRMTHLSRHQACSCPQAVAPACQATPASRYRRRCLPAAAGGLSTGEKSAITRAVHENRSVKFTGRSLGPEVQRWRAGAALQGGQDAHVPAPADTCPRALELLAMVGLLLVGAPISCHHPSATSPTACLPPCLPACCADTHPEKKAAAEAYEKEVRDRDNLDKSGGGGSAPTSPRKGKK